MITFQPLSSLSLIQVTFKEFWTGHFVQSRRVDCSLPSVHADGYLLLVSCSVIACPISIEPDYIHTA